MKQLIITQSFVTLLCRVLGRVVSSSGISDSFNNLLIFIYYLDFAYRSVCFALASLCVLHHQITFIAAALQPDASTSTQSGPGFVAVKSTALNLRTLFPTLFLIYISDMTDNTLG